MLPSVRDVVVLGSKWFPGASFGADFTRDRYQLGNVKYGSPSLLPGWTFTRASTGYAETAAGALVAFASGAPRITDKGLLVEESRTNLLLRSQELDNASWTKSSSTISANATTAPDGTLTADTIIPNAAATTGRIQQVVTTTAASTIVVSAYVKAAGWNFFYFRIAEDAADFAFFNLASGVVGTRTGAFTASTITALANGWYRVTATLTTVGTSYTIRCLPAIVDNSTSNSGDGTSGTHAWGIQVEDAKTFPTSYIPTTTASATRAADVPVLTFAAAPTVPISVVCTFSTDAQHPSVTRRLFNISNAGDTNRIFMSIAATSTQVRFGNQTSNVISGNSFTLGATTTAAGMWNSTDVRGSLNGGTVVTGAFPAATDLTVMSIGHGPSGGTQSNAYIKTLRTYPTAFTDAQLQAGNP